MVVRTTEVELERIAAVCERIRERLPEDEAEMCEAFAHQYFRWVPSEDVLDRSALDLYGAVVSHWRLVVRRRFDEVTVRVLNPDAEQDGWQSPHTVLQIVTEDMPFLVDSVTMELSRLGYGIHLTIHPVIRVLRDAHGRLLSVSDPTSGPAASRPESILYVEIDREPDDEARASLTESVERIIGDVSSAVRDWEAMRRRAEELIGEMAAGRARVAERDLEEAENFVRWLAEDRFTFLGYREYTLVRPDDAEAPARLDPVPGSGLGILRLPSPSHRDSLTPRALEIALEDAPLVLTKANSRATVHRPAYLDYIGVKRFAEDGRVVGERRFLGLYTHAAYRESPLEIPLIRGKVAYVLQRAGFPPDSHDAKALTEICEDFPRDSLLQISVEELFRVGMGILGLGERQRVRVFAWPDALERFVTCIVCLPRDRFNTENRLLVEGILLEAYGGSHVDWSIQLTESTIAKIHLIVHCPDGPPIDADEAELERRIVAAVRAWSDDLRRALVDEHGEQGGLSLLRRFAGAFPTAYRADWPAASAVADIGRIEELLEDGGPIIRLYRPLEAEPGALRCKLLSTERISLSDVLPTFEHMGARVTDERPYEISPLGADPLWIYDFGVRCEIDGVEELAGRFEEAFLGVWHGVYEDDGLGALVLRAGLSARQVTIVRAIAKYLRQVGIPFSDRYIETTLVGHPRVVVLLLDLFAARLDPATRDPEAAESLVAEIRAAIDAVQSLDEDRMLRSMLSVVTAILRTNFYAPGSDARPRPYISFKLDPALVPLLPLPRPRFEIFVYSPRVEGVHLRGGRVARGGLRWSDRREDFRTEILGLMKAQMVKNALIVPVGSKGGFVVKRPPAGGSREALTEEAIACYKTFLAGLLDLTDNIVEGRVVPPPGVVRHDEDDPYLVVAADKGTAAFSDIANGVSEEYGFWLGDAFASGGSQGYDHKAMGITARGAWESVKRHFRELGTDIATTEFTVVGIGEMAGDVFGNGMLLSEHIKLLAAFNHMHVFLDPDPDPAVSFAERRRLFEQPRSSWSDYDQTLISDGGGVFPRTAKSIPLSPQIRAALDIEAEELSPGELISAILRAPVDLLWSGGIGTFVKASTESNADVGDKANDAVRVDGSELRCRVVGEGGNLGLTQLGRIEYAQGGGAVYTDAIDNVAGVNCSDHEVNIKILLDGLVRGGELTVQQRNALLEEMTDAVAQSVLTGSYRQTLALSLGLLQAPGMADVHARLIRHLEVVAGLDRGLEFLPSRSTIESRRSDGRGLCAPELAVVMAYVKIHLYEDLVESDLPEDPTLVTDLERYFPDPLPGRYRAPMQEHRLRREIISTVVANEMVDRAGTTFAFRLGEETGTPASLLARAFAVARDVFEMVDFWASVEALDGQVDPATQLWVLIDARRLVERATRWLARENPDGIDIAASLCRYAPGARMLGEAVPELLEESDAERLAARVQELVTAGAPERLARRVAVLPWLLPTFDIVEVADATGGDPRRVMEVAFRVGSRLELDWLRERILELPRGNRWEALARSALRDDLSGITRDLTRQVVEAGGPGASSEDAFVAWEASHGQAAERVLETLRDIRRAGLYDTTTLPVALREVRDLTRASGAPAGAI